jgi:hypothetical protein
LKLIKAHVYWRFRGWCRWRGSEPGDFVSFLCADIRNETINKGDKTSSNS